MFKNETWLWGGVCVGGVLAVVGIFYCLPCTMVIVAIYVIIATYLFYWLSKHEPINIQKIKSIIAKKFIAYISPKVSTTSNKHTHSYTNIAKQCGNIKNKNNKTNGKKNNPNSIKSLICRFGVRFISHTTPPEDKKS